MSDTMKYVLIGGAVAAVVYFVATRNSAGGSGGAASGANRISEDINAGRGLLDSLTNFVGTVRKPDATGAVATGDASELAYRTTSAPDALGYRSRKAILNAPEALTRSQEQLIGIH